VRGAILCVEKTAGMPHKRKETLRMMRNAIILAVGKSNGFAPFTYEKSKGLFCVKGEIFLFKRLWEKMVFLRVRRF